MKIENAGKKKKKGLIVGIIIGALVLIAAAVACVLFFFPKSVEVAKVTKGSISQNVSEVGNIAADDTITVYSPVSGKISEVEGMKSQYVSSDAILVKFELQSFEESVKGAELNKKYAQDAFDAAVNKNNEYKQMMNTACEVLNRKYGEGTVMVELKDSYRNMKEIVEQHPEILQRAEKAFRENGVEPIVKPIRGGTDGAQLSFRGLPCPNLSTGGYNFHGRKELIPVQSMETMADVLEKLILAE